MPSHGRNNNGKKHRHQKSKPDEPMLVPRLDADPYSPHIPRPSQADSFSSRASTSSARSRMPYDPSPSHGGPAESWRPNHDHPPYDYPLPPPPPEIYSHGHGSGLDMYNPREADWRHGPSEPYRDEYYDRGYPASYPPEPPSWAMPSAYDRPATYWPPADDRVPSSSHRASERRPEPEPASNWRHDRRREKDLQTWQPDNGWEPRPRPSKGKAWEQPSPWETPAMREDKAAAAAAAKEEEDRMWQPAPGWNPSGRGESSQHGRNQPSQRYPPSTAADKMSSKSTKKSGKSKAQRRQEEEDLNNWSRRDTPADSPEKQPYKPRRSSFSRSRSPAASHYSLYSPRGRSRSRSASPANKRRRRNHDYSPRREHSPSAMDDGYRGRESNARYPDSPLRQSAKKRSGRRHSVSSISSVSRSRSPSPAPKPKAVHRLPSATSVDNMPLSYTRPPAPEAVESPAKKKSKKRKKGKDTQASNNPPSIASFTETSSTVAPPRFPPSLPASLPPKPQTSNLPQRPDVDPPTVQNGSLPIPTPMRVDDTPAVPVFRQPAPVPASLPPRPVSYQAQTALPSPPALLPKPSPIPANPVTAAPSVAKTQPSSSANLIPLKPAAPTLPVTKKAGFKPIAQAPQPASSLKHFFPGDDTGEDKQTGVPEAASHHVSEALQVHEHPAPKAKGDRRKNSRVGVRQAPKYFIRDVPGNGRLPRPEKFPSDGEDSGEEDHDEYADERVGVPVASSRELQEVPTNRSQPETPAPAPEQITPVDNDGQRPSISIHATPTTSNGDTMSHEVSREIAPPKPSEPSSPAEVDSVQPAKKSAGSGSRELYAITSQVGEGTFGKVYKARNTVTGVFVALKRIRMEAEKDGFPVTAMREIKLLQSLKHENVIHLYEMMVSKGAVYMVFEYMDHDLTGVLSQSQFTFTPAHLKSLCLQMFAGLAYLHQKGIIHRDIKGSNILLNNQGELKLADFGLARFYHKRRQADYTNRVITLWYRPPELLYGATVYGPEVDMYSAGCIMLELYTRKPVFQGNDEIHQLDVISDIMGTPLSHTGNDWEDVQKLPWYELLKPKVEKPMKLNQLFEKWMPPQAIDIAFRLLVYEPGWRMTAEQVTYDDFWKESPLPEKPVGLASLEGEWHELESKRERAKKRGRKSETVQ